MNWDMAFKMFTQNWYHRCDAHSYVYYDGSEMFYADDKSQDWMALLQYIKVEKILNIHSLIWKNFHTLIDLGVSEMEGNNWRIEIQFLENKTSGKFTKERTLWYTAKAEWFSRRHITNCIHTKITYKSKIEAFWQWDFNICKYNKFKSQDSTFGGASAQMTSSGAAFFFFFFFSSLSLVPMSCLWFLSWT